MSFAWLLLLLAVTVGNLALGFGLACLFGHGPKLPDLLREFAPLRVAAKDASAQLLDFIRSRRSPRFPR
jgi:hypothetical protein